MNSYLRIAFAASAFAWMAGTLSGKAGKNLVQQQTLVIHLYNAAEVNSRTLHWATVEADRLFRAAGIQIDWQPLSAETAEPAACSAFDHPSYVLMRLVRKAPPRASPGALGLARPFAREGRALIFWERLEELRGTTSLQDYTILGYVMAHEIGHVLLHSTEHSAGGVMQTRWSDMSWHLASQGLLAFRPEEAERMKAGLARFHNGCP